MPCAVPSSLSDLTKTPKLGVRETGSSSLDRTFARERAKDSVLDYRGIYAERRGIASNERFDENIIPGLTIKPAPIVIEKLLRGPSPELKPPLTIKLPAPEYAPQPKRPVTPLGPVQAKEPIKPARDQQQSARAPAVASYEQQFEAWKAAREVERQRRRERNRQKDRER